MSRKNDPTKINLEITSVQPFENNKWEGLAINWDSDIGFGTYMIYKRPEKSELYADSEHMDSNEDKAFLQELLRLLLEKVKIED